MWALNLRPTFIFCSHWTSLPSTDSHSLRSIQINSAKILVTQKKAYYFCVHISVIPTVYRVKSKLLYIALTSLCDLSSSSLFSLISHLSFSSLLTENQPVLHSTFTTTCSLPRLCLYHLLSVLRFSHIWNISNLLCFVSLLLMLL